MLLIDVWKKNGEKFPFKAKANPGNAWYKEHYSKYPHLNFTGWMENGYRFVCAENPKGWMAATGTDIWLPVEDSKPITEEDVKAGKIKIGDKVRCINTTTRLTIGSIYTVVKLDKYHLTVSFKEQEKECQDGWIFDRFELVPTIRGEIRKLYAEGKITLPCTVLLDKYPPFDNNESMDKIGTTRMEIMEYNRASQQFKCYYIRKDSIEPYVTYLCGYNDVLVLPGE